LLYLFDNADAEAVVFHAGFADRLEEIRARLPLVKLWVAVDEPAHAAPDWAESYEQIVAKLPAQRPVIAPWGRSNDDLLILYPGAPTALPRGVLGRQEAQIGVTGFGGNVVLGVPPLEPPEASAARIAQYPRRIGLSACPLMHGTGLFSTLMT